MNWFKSNDLVNGMLDLDYIKGIKKNDDDENKEYLIDLVFVDTDDEWPPGWDSFLYDDKNLRDKDYDDIWRQLKNHTIASKGHAWTLDVRDLVRSRTSKEK